MNCCENCFKDEEILRIIKSYRTNGDCDFCNTKQIFICDINYLTEIFDTLISNYKTVKSIEFTIPNEFQGLLKDKLLEDWNIFNVNSQVTHKLITNICKEKFNEFKELFTTPVVIPECFNEEYKKEYSLINNLNWENFVKEIKHENRFHLQNKINLQVFDEFLDYFSIEYSQDHLFYRSRLTDDNYPLACEKMGPPNKLKNSPGRANPKGIKVLYLSNDIKTTIYESRAGIYDYLTIGEFVLLENIKVINLSKIVSLSPFLMEDTIKYLINKNVFDKINDEIAKPLRKKDSDLDYLPTQYLSEYIKFKGYDGIEYKSTLNKDGNNYAIFDEKKLKCSKTFLREITNINYDYK